MTVPSFQKKPETTLQKEGRIFRQQFKRLINCLLNKIFDLSIKGSQRRNRTITILFIMLGLIFSLNVHSLTEWAGELRLLFQGLLSPSFLQANPGIPMRFFNFAFGAVLAPQTLRFLPLFSLPFIIALQSAARYLADIFEIQNIKIAREFIQQVALTGSRNSITIRKGDIAEKDKYSPIYLIGGPGQVQVELDSAALFEKPNGQPHVIGPTIKGKANLEGFERFRLAIDLRDQYTDPIQIKSRSFDGVRISTDDVRLLFSVKRGDAEPSAETPHPFSEEAIKVLVYEQASRVVLNGPYPSELPFSWTGTIQGLIRSRLGGFMSKHRLAEYLASIGIPEVERARQREDEIVMVGREIIPEEDSLAPRNVPPPPEFQARHTVSNLFSQFAEDFTKNAGNRGVQLSWIGVGTWKTPNEIVPERHLEAWRLNRENMERGSKGALDNLRQESQLQQILRLIKNVPLARFQQNKGKEHKSVVRDLLIGYREQLIETIVLLKKSNKEAPQAIYAAKKHIENILGIKHWVGGGDPTSGDGAGKSSKESGSSGSKSGFTTGVPSMPPVSPEEEYLFQNLYTKVGRNAEQVELLIAAERKNAPTANRIEWLQRAIDHWLKDNR